MANLQITIKSRGMCTHTICPYKIIRRHFFKSARTQKQARKKKRITNFADFHFRSWWYGSFALLKKYQDCQMEQRRFNEAPPVGMISCRWDWNSQLQSNKPETKYLKKVLQIITLLKTFPTQNVSRGTIGTANLCSIYKEKKHVVFIGIPHSPSIILLLPSFHRVHLLIAITFIFHRWYGHKWTCGHLNNHKRSLA